MTVPVFPCGSTKVKLILDICRSGPRTSGDWIAFPGSHGSAEGESELLERVTISQKPTGALMTTTRLCLDIRLSMVSPE